MYQIIFDTVRFSLPILSPDKWVKSKCHDKLSYRQLLGLLAPAMKPNVRRYEPLRDQGALWSS